MTEFDGTIRSLIAAYKADRISPYQKLRFRTKENYNSLMRRIEADHGSAKLGSLKYRSFLEWHSDWSPNGERIPMAHSLMGMVRTLVGFGVVFLEDRECERLSGVLHKMKFQMGKGRDQQLNADQAEAVRIQAHKDGFPSMALAQAIQFEGTLRQKDIIGEWAPLSERGVSDVTWALHGKWLRGIRWSEIDDDMILRHINSKTQKLSEIDLKLAPMVLEELQVAYCDLGEPLTRAKLPASGPVILNEDNGRPYLTHKFRRRWRTLARACGIPDDVQNRDTRAGAITEAIESGASIEDAQKAARHSTTAMTAKYWRGDAKAAARAMTLRAADRALKKKTERVA
jgi:hypothetical protein